METRIKRHLKLATDLARKSDNGSTYFFCGVLAKGNNVLSIGYNQPSKTHPLATNKYHKIHCELDTILGVSSNDLIGSTLYLVRVGYAGRKQWMISKPCSHCENLLRRARVRFVYFTISNNAVGKWDLWTDKRSVIKV